MTKAGDRLSVTQTNDSNTVTLTGDYTSTAFWIGEQYEASYTFSDFHLHEQTEMGTRGLVSSGRYQIRTLSLAYDRTGYFRAEVTPDYQTTYSYPFTGRLLGDGGNLIGGVPIGDGTFRIPIYAKNNQVQLLLKNDTPLPSNIMGAEFEVLFRMRSNRMRT